MKRRTFLGSLGAAAAMFAQRPHQRKPNIVFIMADDLGYADLGCYGQKEILTPNLDRMASEGLRFTQAYAGCTVCAPSRCTLMTGKHTGNCWVRGNRRPEVPLRPQDVTVAEVLKRAGYTTGMFGKWGLGPAETIGIPNRKGFDEWFGYLDQVHAHNYWTDTMWDNREEVFLQKNFGAKKGTYAQQLFTQHALHFIGRHKEEPFFLYLPYTTPHGAWDPPSDAPYTDKDWPQVKKNIAAMVTSLDADVGKILACLHEHGLDENTLVIFTGDNGAHPTPAKLFNSDAPFRGAKRDMYEGGIREPFIARWKGKIQPGVSDQVFAFWDMLPTFAEIGGGLAPPGLDGISMAAAILGKPQKRQHEYLYWEFYEKGFQQAVRMGDWKGISVKEGAPLELYDLKTDPSETKNIASSHPDIVQKIERIMKASHSANPYWPDTRPNAPKAEG